MPKIRKTTLAILMFLIISVSIIGASLFWTVQAKDSGNHAQIELEGFTWNHTNLKVLILTNETASWWDPIYVDSVLRAVGVWNDAFKTNAENYTGYQYMSKLNLVASVSEDCRPDYDIYVSWTDQPFIEEDTGWYALTYSVAGVAQNSSITLAVNSGLGVGLSGIDMQNLAVHELGHSLGLGHCNFDGDIMFPTSLLSSPARGVSNLDVFGVATVFKWAGSNSEINSWRGVSSVGLPSGIRFAVFSSGNLPSYSFFEPVVGSLRVFALLVLRFFGFGLLIGVVLLVVVLGCCVGVCRRRSDS